MEPEDFDVMATITIQDVTPDVAMEMVNLMRGYEIRLRLNDGYEFIAEINMAVLA